MASDLAGRFRQETLPPAYDKYLVPKVMTPWARLLIDFADVRPGEVVLDVATGPGTVARLVAERVGPAGRVVGADISAPMLAVARGKPLVARGAPVEYVECPATALNVDAGTFDVALCHQGLQFFPDRLLALSEIRRALKPGGRLGVAVWGTRAPAFAAPEEALRECGAAPLQPAQFGLQPNDLREALSAAGFEVRRAEDLTLTVTYDSVDEIMEHISAGPNGPTMAALTPGQGADFRERLARKLQPWTAAGSISSPMLSRFALALKPV